jgi:hypothetical protein
MNRVPRLWRSGMLGFPLIPSPAGLGSRLASGPTGLLLSAPNASAFHDPYPLLQPPRTRHALRDCRAKQILSVSPKKAILEVSGELAQPFLSRISAACSIVFAYAMP